VRIWDVTTGNESASVEAGSDNRGKFLSAVAWSPDGEWLATAGRGDLSRSGTGLAGGGCTRSQRRPVTWAGATTVGIRRWEERRGIQSLR